MATRNIQIWFKEFTQLLKRKDLEEALAKDLELLLSEKACIPPSESARTNPSKSEFWVKPILKPLQSGRDSSLEPLRVELARA
jgi:hypothetical protein